MSNQNALYDQSGNPTVLGVSIFTGEIRRLSLNEDGTISGGASGGSEFFTNPTPTPVTVGGIPAGSTFAGQTMSQMWNALLYPYQSPAFSSFSISGQTTPLEVGNSTNANPTFIWGTTNSANVVVNSLVIRDMTGAVDLATGLANDGSQAVVLAPITKVVPATHQFRITGTNTNSITFNSLYTVSWQYRKYYGESLTTPLVEADVEGLRVSTLSSGFAGTYAYLGGGYKYLCYPVAWGTATTFVDTATNFNVPFQPVYTVSVTNAFSQTALYNVHRSTNIMGGGLTIAVS